MMSVSASPHLNGSTPKHEASRGITVTLPFRFNDRVRIDGNDGIEGVVTRYIIHDGGAQIEVAWFANGDHKQGWFESWRVARPQR
jgi:hypothetical protein